MSESPGKILAAARAFLGLTQRALGERIGVAELTVSRWELNKSFPQRGLWPDIERTLKVKMADVLSGKMPDRLKKVS